MKRTRCRICIFAIAIVLTATTCASAQDAPKAAHAVAQKFPVRGVPNFGQVTPNLYRGAQPSMRGFESLEKMGMNLIVDLRDGNEGNTEETIVTKDGMKFVAIPWRCTDPKDDYFAKFLAILRDNPDKKVFVHCHAGVDRTGMMIAAYRISEQGWTADEALREMKSFGFSSLHQFICSGLEAYELRFPTVVSTSPAFQTLRAAAGQKSTPPTPAGPKP